MDLILGRFADASIAAMDDAELREFAVFLEINDRDLIQWFTGEAPPPLEQDTVLFRKIKQNHIFTVAHS